MTTARLIGTSALGAGLLAVLLACGGEPVLPVADAVAQTPGTRHEVRPNDLPPPAEAESVSNRSETVWRPEGVPLAAPPGFEVSLVAEDLSDPREILALPGGDILISEPDENAVTLLRDTDGDGAADQTGTFASGRGLAYGLVLHDGHLYLSDAEGVLRAPYEDGMSSVESWEEVTEAGVFGSSSGHHSRTLAIDAEGRLYAGVGSADNIAEEDPPRATIQVFSPDGSGQRTFASGLRNPIGLAFHPETGELFTVVNERDGLGDRLVPDYLTHVEEGAFYGWPYSYIGSNPQPGLSDRRPDLVDEAVVPDLLFESHSAPIDLAFYQAEDGPFPDDWSGGAFVSLRGSWNRADPTGYKVVFAPFEDGRPVGHYVDFLTGFRLGETSPARVWGRPTGVAVTEDGDLLVADDTGGTVWRVRYTGG